MHLRWIWNKGGGVYVLILFRDHQKLGVLQLWWLFDNQDLQVTPKTTIFIVSIVCVPLGRISVIFAGTSRRLTIV